jgi:hypothetical protein
VARFIFDTAPKVVRDMNWISFNLDGIWGGNMYAGAAGAILPNKITSKHNIRYVGATQLKGSADGATECRFVLAVRTICAGLLSNEQEQTFLSVEPDGTWRSE